jgi:hypothetical protein
MTASQLIQMLTKLPPDTVILGWIDGGTIRPHELEDLAYCAHSNTALIDFLNSDEYAAS